MARLEFAILQHLEGEFRIVLQRDAKELLERLQIRVRENMKGQHTELVKDAIDKAFNGLVKEFKDETIRLV